MVNLVEILALGAVNEPLISIAIWALLLINVLLSSDSAVVNLVEILALGAVNEPLISDAICAEPLITPSLRFTNGCQAPACAKYPLPVAWTWANIPW